MPNALGAFQPCFSTGFNPCPGAESPPNTPTLTPVVPSSSYPINTNFTVTIPVNSNSGPILYQASVSSSNTLGGGVASSYKLYESRNNSTFSEIKSFAANNSSMSISRNLSSSGNAYYRYKACNYYGCSDFSPTRTITITGGAGYDTGPVTPISGGSNWHQKGGTVSDHALILPSVPASNFFGPTPGKGGVSGGAANYNIPVEVVPGRAGMSPNISINYSSRSGGGIVGVGFSLSGTSAISRCAPTLAQDGHNGGVALSAADKLCLNGQRLVATEGSYGSANTLYKLELDNNTLVRQKVGSIQQGSTYFEVTYANGLREYFGGTRSARVVPVGSSRTLTWLINRTQDVSNTNHMSYTYEHFGNEERLLKQIKYTGNGATDGNRSVNFVYENNSKFNTYFIAGGKTRSTKRLRRIETFYGASKVRSYNLKYKTSPASGRSLLNSIQECFHQGNNPCRSKTEFSWNDAEPLFAVERLVTAQGDELVDGYGDSPSRISPRGDMNGDGVRDWPNHFVDAEGNSLSANNYDQSACAFNSVTGQNQCFSPDFNKDGITDGWRVANGKLQIGYSREGRPNDWTHLVNTNISIERETNPYTDRNYSVANIADYNGDGWVDIVVHEAESLISLRTGNVRVSGDIALYLHSGNPNSPYPTRRHLQSLNAQQSVNYAGDMDGNGLPDFVLSRVDTFKFSPTMETLLLTKLSNNGSIYFESRSMNLPDNRWQTLEDNFGMLVDVNSDGLPDWIGKLAGAFNELHYKLNKGNGTFEGVKPLGYRLAMRDIAVSNGRGQEFISTPKFGSAMKQADIDGDGVAEILIPGERIVTGCTKFYAAFNQTEWVCGDSIYEVQVQRVVTGNRESFSNFTIDGTHDKSIYKYNALHMDEDSLGNLTINVVPTDLYGTRDAIIVDGLGKGLPDMVFPYYETTGPYKMQNASGVMAGKPQGKMYFSRNYGATDKQSPAKTDYRAIDTLESVNNNEGVVLNWRYLPLTSTQPSEFYATDNAIVDDNHFHFTSSIYVVSEFEQSNGLGGFNSTHYKYRGAMYNSEGRGFRGFRTIIERNVSQGIETHTDFKQQFPYSSLIEKQVTYKSLGRIKLSETINIWSLNSSHEAVNVPGVSQVFRSSSSTTNYDLTSEQQLSYNNISVNQNDVDAFGNVEKETTNHTDEFGTHVVVKESAYQASQAWPHKLAWTRVSKQFNPASAVPSKHISTTLDKTVTTRYNAWDENHRKPTEVTVAQGTRALSSHECDVAALGGCTRTSSVYNAHGLPASVTVIGNIITGNQDNKSLESRVTTTTYTDNGTHRSNKGYFPFEVTLNSGSTTLTEKVETDPRAGVTLSMYDANNVKTTTDYDELYRPIKIEVAGSPPHHIRYRRPDSDSPNSSVVMRRGVYQAGTPNASEYKDAYGRTLRTSHEGFDGTSIFVDTRYDALGRLTHESTPHTGNPIFTEYSGFDVLGRPSSKVTPATESGEDVTTSYEYTGLETRIDTSAADGHNLTMYRTSNSLGQLMNTVDALGGVTQYAYDAAGNPVVIRDAANNSIFANYDHLGRKTWVRDPNQGLTQFTYNDFGELEKEVDANSDVIRYELDRLGRVKARLVADSSNGNKGSATFTWDTKKKGLLSSESSQGVTKSYNYDHLARPTSTITTIGATQYVVTTQYDGNYGRPNAITYPNGLKVKLEYNARGYLSAERNAASGYVYRQALAQDAYGNNTVTRLSNNKLVGDYLYSQRTGQMLNSRVKQSISTLHHLNYSDYDSYGNIKLQLNLKSGINSSDTFVYDELHRIERSTTAGSGFSANIDYAYDAVGNIKKKTDYSTNNGNAYTYSNGTNRLTRVALKQGGNATFGYDNKGNQTHRNNRLEVKYNVFNKPYDINRLGSRVRLDYDASFNRFKQTRTVNGKTISTYYIDKLYEVEIEGSTRKETAYISDVAIISEKGSDKKIRFTHRDRLGSATTFTDHNGTVRALRSYDVFGKPRLGDGSLIDEFGNTARLGSNLLDLDMSTRRGFTDHEHLDEVEIIHMNGRVYDYNLGRFLSVDSIVHGGSQGINPYSYIMNNPLSGTDPTGYVPEQETIEVDKDAKVYTDSDGNNYVSAGDGSGDMIKINSVSGNVGGTQITKSFGDNGKMTSFSASNSAGTFAITDIGSQSQRATFTPSDSLGKDPIANSNQQVGEGYLLADNNLAQPETLADRFNNANAGFKEVLSHIAKAFPYESKMFNKYITNIDTTHWPNGEVGFEKEIQAIRGFTNFLNHHVNMQLMTGDIKKEALDAFPNKLKSELMSGAMGRVGVPNPVGAMFGRYTEALKMGERIDTHKEMMDIYMNRGPQAFNENFIKEYY